MRILAIRGENLASLAAPFAVDLAAGPIGATGIFAITGETGAGKSTILDALCLALYGRYPRVAAGRREDTPDPSGETVSSNDGRAILRRGAAQGFAEVDFLGQDGVPYRVRWETIRARGKADGRLQNDRRSLHRLDDGSPVEAGKTLVASAVERLTDLTFDQFRRTVLLAQGEFDAFLLAADGERAELLEKITGTGVYSEISKRVHAGTEAHRAGLKLLETRRDAVGLLDAPVRDAILAERGAVLAEVERLGAEHRALRGQIDHATRLAAARQQVEAAETRVAAAQAATAASRPEADRLAEHDAVEPLRRLADEVATAMRERQEAATALSEAQARLAAAEAASDHAAGAHAQAHARDEAEETRFKAFGPIWTEAARLDSRIEMASTEAGRWELSAQAAEAALAAAGAERDDRERRFAAAQDAQAKTARQLEADARHAVLADRADEIGTLFAKHAELRAAHAAARSASTQAREEAAKGTAIAAAEEVRIGEARAARNRSVEEREAHARTLADLDEPTMQVRADALGQLREIAARAAIQSGRHDQGVAALAEAERIGAEAGAGRATAEAAGIAATQAQTLAEAARREIAALADLAEVSASDQAAHLRSLLVPGEACPVCGAVDHPRRDGDDRLAAVAEAIRSRRDGLDREIRAATEARAAAGATMAAESERFAAAERWARAARTACAEAAEAYAGLRPHLVESRLAAGIDADVPAFLGPGTGEAIVGLDAVVQATRAEVTTARDGARRLRDDIAVRARAIEAASTAIEAAERTVRAGRDTGREAQIRAEREATRANGLEERLASLAREAAPYLSAADLAAADLDRDAGAAAARAKALGTAYAALRETHRTLCAALQDLTTQRAGISATAAGAEASAVAARAEAGARLAELADLRSERATLLGGEATAIHRTRINDSRRAAREALKAADSARSDAAAARAAAQAGAEGAAARDARGAVRHAAAQTAFVEACGARPPEAVMTLLAIAPEITQALRTRVGDLTRAVATAETALATRRADLETLARDAPEIDRAEVEATASILSDQISGWQQRLGGIASEIARDDAARLQAAGLCDEIAAAQADFATWDAVNDAVGSANGSKFRSFAQGVTLEHLVHLANEQLEALSPRYRLARSQTADLALHVLDRDMGDELRATRSLSGGERFLVSLALALALSGLEGRDSFVDTLFIDEGFGSLDAETLDLAVDALETLQGRGRKVGVITHVAAMIERIAVQVRVEKRGNGRSVVRVIDGAGSPA
ncbi:AAA family ATPase [Methylobacterium sp. BTF04]|uniref:AAA family ATPase n=1 Tax=Methylobacterium sp. BTF04 TaxID=2708300 RepID=UPI0013D7318F|nr:AAA family ATPase [Methylobacterium sp. BTF04]